MLTLEIITPAGVKEIYCSNKEYDKEGIARSDGDLHRMVREYMNLPGYKVTLK